MKIEIEIPRIYTGSFDKIDKYRDANLSLIAVSYNKPDDATDVKLINILAPEKSLMQGFKRGEINWMDFDISYRQQISRTMDLKLLVRALACIGTVENTKGVILLSFEKQPFKSHRSILADILNKSKLIDVAVEEYKYR